jgi:hypothetical protein
MQVNVTLCEKKAIISRATTNDTHNYSTYSSRYEIYTSRALKCASFGPDRHRVNPTSPSSNSLSQCPATDRPTLTLFVPGSNGPTGLNPPATGKKNVRAVRACNRWAPFSPYTSYVKPLPISRYDVTTCATAAAAAAETSRDWHGLVFQSRFSV